MNGHSGNRTSFGRRQLKSARAAAYERNQRRISLWSFWRKNLERLASLDPVHRDGLQRAVDRAAAAQRGFAENDDAICSAELRNQGVEITELDEAAREAFAEATRAEVEITRSQFAPELLELFDKELSAA